MLAFIFNNIQLNINLNTFIYYMNSLRIQMIDEEAL